MGIVRIGNDVEIGACTTIDRARFGETRIGNGVKVDVACQLAHNVHVGDNTYLSARVGLAGSSSVGAYSILGPEVGATNGTRIGDQIIAAARTVFVSDTLEKGQYYGNPGLPHMKEKRRYLNTLKIEKLLTEIKELRSKVESLENSKNTQ